PPPRGPSRAGGSLSRALRRLKAIAPQVRRSCFAPSDAIAAPLDADRQQSRAEDDRRADQRAGGRQVAEDEPSPEHRVGEHRIFERRQQRRANDAGYFGYAKRIGKPLSSLGQDA